MLKKLEKVWPYISILLLFVLVSSLFYWKLAVPGMSILLIGLSVIAALVFVVGKPVQAHKAGKLSVQVMWRTILVEGLGLLLSTAAVILAAGKIAGLVAQAVGKAWGTNAGILSALAAGLVVGFGLGWAIKTVWTKLTLSKSSIG